MSSSHSTPAPGLSAEEVAERELRQMMSSSPPPRDRSPDVDEIDELSQDSDEPIGGLITRSTTPSLTTPASIRRELATARRKAEQLKLHPYQRTSVEEFVKGSPMFRQSMLYIQLFSVENQISGIKSAAPPFVSSPQLLENIKSFVVAVLLSCNLSAYKKNSVPVGHVMAILTTRSLSYVPENLASDSYAHKIVKSDVQEELTQARSRIKKSIKDSIGTSPQESDSIFDLATAILSNSQSIVSVPLCARIALLRKIYVECSDGTFWDKVDARLLLIRTTAAGEGWKITKAFEHILDNDRSTYGNNATYTLNGVNDVFQNSVDDMIAATSH